jgi:hypothetical protein
MVKSLAPGAPSMNMQGQKDASHIFALQHEAKKQKSKKSGKNSDVQKPVGNISTSVSRI